MGISLKTTPLELVPAFVSSCNLTWPTPVYGGHIGLVAMESLLDMVGYMSMQGLSQAVPLCQSRTAIGIVPLKNGQGDNLSPSKFSEKTRKEAHTKRFISVQKLQAETECGKYILSHL